MEIRSWKSYHFHQGFGTILHEYDSISWEIEAIMPEPFNNACVSHIYESIQSDMECWSLYFDNDRDFRMSDFDINIDIRHDITIQYVSICKVNKIFV